MNRDRANSPRWSSQRGQTFLAIAVFIALFLVAALGLATDYTQLWAHRQISQAATDAACQAGAADLFLQYLSPSPPSGISYSWFSSGAGFNCSTNTGSPPCQYATFNGYSGSNVAVAFPKTFPGAPNLTGFTVPHPFIQVTITDPVPMLFTKLVGNSSTVNVGATAYCGVDPVPVPIPIVVLDPTDQMTLNLSGSASITIIGGPSQAIHVNSNSVNAISNPASINLSQAGPSGTGADVDVVGNESEPGGVNLGSSGQWVDNALPFADPWQSIAAPSEPGSVGTATPVGFGTDGCPDPAGCVEFTGGDYTNCSQNAVNPGGNFCANLKSAQSVFNAFAVWQASHAYTIKAIIQPTALQGNLGLFTFQATNGGTSGKAPPAWPQKVGSTVTDSGVVWKNIGILATKPVTGIFAPGLYYLGEVPSQALDVENASTARMSTAAGDGTIGVMFYFSGTTNTHSLNLNSTSGQSGGQAPPCTGLSATPGVGVPAGCVVQYKTGGSSTTWTSVWAPTGGFVVQSLPMQCPGGPPNPPAVPSTMYGIILLGPCSGAYGGGGGVNRGFLFFQSRTSSVPPNLNGGGGLLLSGFIYFHDSSCPTACTQFTLSGGSGSGSYAFGNFVADEITVPGSSTIKMILNPNVTATILRPQLLK